MDNNEVFNDGWVGSPTDIINMYEKQLSKFSDLGFGGITEFNTVVTPTLVKVTIRRLSQLMVLQPHTKANSLRITRYRKQREQLSQIEELLNEYTSYEVPEQTTNG